MNKNIDGLLTRGVGEFIDPEGIFRKKLETNPEKIVIKFGIDPTRPDIHLGHAVVLRKLRQFQELGCKIIFLVGDYTAQIGDPTGKSKERPEISFEEIHLNAGTYLKQIGAILDILDKNKYELIMNSIWYQSATDYPTGSMSEKGLLWEKDRSRFKLMRPDHALPTVTLWNFMSTLRRITYAQLIERDMFQNRIKSGEQLYMHEMMYPILQGVDSYVIAGFFDSCDLEVGGTDQTFNMLMGRTVMKLNSQEPQAVLAFKLLEGLDGKEKMSKSLDNYIGITDEPNDMYGKLMSIPDSSIVNYLELCTFTTMNEVENIRKGLENNKLHPKEIKMSLAKQVVAIYHGEKSAEEAEKSFIETFSKGGIPQDIKTVRADKDKSLVEVFLEHALVSSKTEFNRLNKEGAIKEIENGVYRVGKHRFLRIERN